MIQSESLNNRLDELFQEWHRLGGAVLLAEQQTTILNRRPEEIIAESTTYCRESGRLMWVVVDWLIHHIEEIDTQKLIQETLQNGDLSVLGVMCDVAHLRMNHPKFKQIMSMCRPNPQTEPFFHRVARSQLATTLTKENSLEVFRRWNYWCRELRYL